MQVIINEDLGLDAALTVEDFTEDEKEEALATLQRCFEETANWVLSDVLDQKLPDTIIVEMDENEVDELNGESMGIRLANFNVLASDSNCFVFTVLEKTVMDILNHAGLNTFKSTITHEMLHAADMKVLANSHRLFEGLWKEISDYRTPIDRKRTLAALYGTLLTCDRFRAEGVAILGEQLLSKSEFGCKKEETLKHFKTVLEYAIRKASLLAQARFNAPVFDENLKHAVYRMAPYVLLWALERLGLVDSVLTAKVENGLESGRYELTDEECYRIIRAALSVSLSDYIQGLLLLGNDLVPMRPFLELCSLIQKKDDILDESDVQKNIEAYMCMVEQKESEQAFSDAINQIMGGLMDAEDIDAYYQHFSANTPDNLANPKVKEKIGQLYDIFKDDKDQDRKRVAQRALTYLFDEEDIIHDDMNGLGYVDDMIVIDSALRILNQRSN